ncbi:hypothetical protein K4P78_09215 [Staphylococcus epidermidis]|nr:hypothetical protein [Staphylococcus epidermidis]
MITIDILSHNLGDNQLNSTVQNNIYKTTESLNTVENNKNKESKKALKEL